MGYHQVRPLASHAMKLLEENQFDLVVMDQSLDSTMTGDRTWIK
jgi:hypothetical protein